jgi:hypothetical protein
MRHALPRVAVASNGAYQQRGQLSTPSVIRIQVGELLHPRCSLLRRHRQACAPLVRS